MCRTTTYADQQVAAIAAAEFTRKLLKPVDAWTLGEEIVKALGRR